MLVSHAHRHPTAKYFHQQSRTFSFYNSLRSLQTSTLPLAVTMPRARPAANDEKPPTCLKRQTTQKKKRIITPSSHPFDYVSSARMRHQQLNQMTKKECTTEGKRPFSCRFVHFCHIAQYSPQRQRQPRNTAKQKTKFVHACFGSPTTSTMSANVMGTILPTTSLSRSC